MSEIQEFVNRIICGDAMEELKKIPDESIDCCITSPPYWGLRDYGIKQQIGSEETVKEYLEKTLTITAELKRVLKKTGTMWWNHGDSYGGKFGEFGPKYNLIRKGGFPQRKHTAGGIDKCLMLQNYRLVIDMTDKQGWILRNIIIWHKPNGMPSAIKDRFTVDYEPIFFFSKSKKYWFEQIFEPNCGTSIKRAEYENRRKNPSSIGSKSEHYGMPARFVKLNPQGHNKRCVWSINTKGFSGAHFAVFPEKLIEPMVRAGCPKDGIILDPFSGAGTTCLVAKKLGRHYLGIELNPDYIKIAERRLVNVIPDMFLTLKK